MSATTEPQTLQDSINALAARLDLLRQKRCPVHVGPGAEFVDREGGATSLCPTCHGTGTITYPKLQAAWEEVRLALNIQNTTVYSLPEYMWRGLLEGVVVKAGLLLEEREVESTGRRFRWYGDVPSLGKAIMEALNATA